jgi:hypothetical protein
MRPGPSADNGARQERNAKEARGRLLQGLARVGLLARALAVGGREDLINLSRPTQPGLTAGALSLIAGARARSFSWALTHCNGAPCALLRPRVQYGE